MAGESKERRVRPVALVTGGSRGIGLGIAKALAAAGHDVAVGGVREAESVGDALAEVRALGAEVLYCRGDVADPAARAAVLDGVDERFGRIDVLVNNAGVAPAQRADILEATEDSYERVMRINLQGPYFLTQAVARRMIERKKANPHESACIVNVSSISATVASPSRGEYCISKAGIAMATKLWAVRLGEFDIPVYEVRPGIVRTDMTASVSAKYDKLLSEGLCVQSRWGLPEDVGKAVAMLARGDLAYSTGQVVMVDGGLTLERL